MDIYELAKESKDILKPYGEIDVLLYYGIVVPTLSEYLKDKEIATKNWMEKKAFKPSLLKRGSTLRTLKPEYFKEVTPEFLELRSQTKKLDLVLEKITDKQHLLWDYFLPRHLSDLFYATNSEGTGKPIKRIFIDIDRQGVGQKITQKVTYALIEEIQSDNLFWNKHSGELFVMWTGNSFHVYIFLDDPITNEEYKKTISYTKKEPLASFTGRWAQKVRSKTGIKVIGSHEKIKNAIILDPSQTPSGKLCRAPFSLHMKDENTVNGVAIPLTLDMLDNNNLIDELKQMTPKKVVEQLRTLSDRLPTQINRKI